MELIPGFYAVSTGFGRVLAGMAWSELASIHSRSEPGSSYTLACMVRLPVQKASLQDLQYDFCQEVDCTIGDWDDWSFCAKASACQVLP